ncbi:MAG: alginate lyase family protein [Planctomycetaceae bacterium]
MKDKTSISVSAHQNSTPSWWLRITRLWFVLRYYRPSQLAMRAWKQVRAKIPRLGFFARDSSQPKVIEVRHNPGFRFLLQSRRADGKSQKKAYNPKNQQVIFLNESHQFGEQIDWTCRSLDAPLLWRFHLHYHEFLLDLLRGEISDVDTVTFWDVIEHWIKNNTRADAASNQAAWHPYCISRRLPVWMMVWAEFPPTADQQAIILASLHEQSAFLAAHLEWDLRGNHLLLNLTTLALASLFFRSPTADGWREKAKRHLRIQLKEQILPHGEHVERCPMYHAQMLQVLLDVRDASVQIDEELSNLCQDAVGRMAGWLESILPPDHRIPLLSDGGFCESPEPEILLSRTRNNSDVAQATTEDEPTAHRGGLYGDTWIWRDGCDFLLFDTGPVCPDWLPAHAHSDLLTIEASLAGQRLFVDSGTFDYQDGDMRRYCRSTRAHNVLQVDDVEQCDVWSRFRMGYRGWPKPAESGTQGHISWCRSTHNAYRRLGVAEVGRWIGCRPKGPWVCVDWAKGRGEHQLTHWLHLHPSVNVKRCGPASVELAVGDHVCELRFLTDGDLEVEEAWYCPEFGKRIPSTLLNWTVRTTMPGVVAWSLSWGDTDIDTAFTLSADRGSITWGHEIIDFMN